MQRTTRYTLQILKTCFDVIQGCSQAWSISGHYQFELGVLFKSGWQGKDFHLQKAKLLGPSGHVIHGFITAVSEYEDRRAGAYWRLQFSSPLSCLQHTVHYRVFVDYDIAQLITAIFNAQQWPPEHYAIKLNQSYPRQAFIQQYAESDLHFLQRHLTHWGLLFTFEQQHDFAKLIISDEQTKLSDNPPIELSYRSCSQQNAGLASYVSPQEQYQLIPATVILNDYASSDPDARLQVQAQQEDTMPSMGCVYRFGEGYTTTKLANQLAKLRLQAYQNQCYRIKTECTDFNPGDIVHLTEGVNSRWNKQFLIIKIQLHIADPYYIELILIPCTKKYCTNPDDYPTPIVSYHLATIEADKQNKPMLDEQGRYRVRFNYDTTSQAGKASAPLQLMQTAVGNHYGWHFPLYPNTLVCIAYYHGDPDRPFIMGALRATARLALSAHQHTIKTKAQHQLTMNDQQNSSAIELATRANKQLLGLYDNAQKQQILCLCQQGEMQLWAGKNLNLITQHNYQSTVGGDYRIEAEHDYSLQTQTGDLQQLAEGNLIYTAKDSLTLNSTQLHLTGKDALLMQAQSIELCATTRTIETTKPANELNIHTDQLISLQSQYGPITIEQAGASVRLDPSGQITIRAKQVFLST